MIKTDIRWDDCSQCYVSDKFNAYSTTGAPGSWVPRINWNFKAKEIAVTEDLVDDAEKLLNDFEPTWEDLAIKKMGLKYDTDKPRVDLVDPYFYLEMGRVLGYGATKYTKDGVDGAQNWRKGISVQRLIGSIERHIAAFKAGETYDDESSLEALAHAAVDCMMASWMVVNHSDMDDRFVNQIR